VQRPLYSSFTDYGAKDLKAGIYHNQPIWPAPIFIQSHDLVDLRSSLAPELDISRNSIWEDIIARDIVPFLPKTHDLRTPPAAVHGQREWHDLQVTFVYTEFLGKELQAALEFFVIP